MQPPVQSRLSANGFGRRRGERDLGSRPENKSQFGKSNSSNRFPTTGNRSGGYGGPSQDRLVYVSTCLIGSNVDVQVKSGAVYSGIFHAISAEKDIGIVLKMARMTKVGLKPGVEPVGKIPLKTLIIPSKELVQVIAKDVSVTRDGLSAEVQSDKQAELIIDSHISQSRHGEMERELEPWVPDEDDQQRPELENVFDGSWNRGWNQFEANEALFGVKSTFDEELYTTKLDRGPQMRDREREAQRIAREIEGEDTHDLHLAEERGIQLGDDVDEETRYSSVIRHKLADDSGYEESEDTLLDSCNDETFGDCSTAAAKSSTNWTKGKSNNVSGASSSSCVLDQAQALQSSSGMETSRSDSYDHTVHVASESSENRRPENQLVEHEGMNENNTSPEKKPVAEETQLSKSEDSSSSVTGKKESHAKEISNNANSSASSRNPAKSNEKLNASGESVEGSVSGKPPHSQTQAANSRGRPGSSASSRSDYVVAPTSGPSLSPSSSVGSLSSEKSSLNPHAKEFKLNPNAKSFVPLQSPVRPSPVADGSYYYQSNIPAVPQIPGMPVGIAPPFGHQPVMFNPQGAPLQPPQAYYHPSGGPQYAQQMFVHPRQVLYVPGYHQPETQYRGRDY